MKISRTLSMLPVAAFLVGAPFAVAQTASVTTTTNSMGTISEMSPDTIIIRSESAPAPMRYSYTKSTTYVDESGAPVSMDLVKSGLPVTVYYAKEGERMVANRVVVRKTVTTSVPAATTTTIVPAPTTTVVPVTPIITEKRTTTTTTETK